jgi:predicted RNase H-like nuclease
LDAEGHSCEQGRARGSAARSADDILDAFAALRTADRIVRGAAVSFPANPVPIDSAGLPMSMLA